MTFDWGEVTGGENAMGRIPNTINLVPRAINISQVYGLPFTKFYVHVR